MDCFTGIENQSREPSKSPNELCHSCSYFESDWPYNICHYGGKLKCVGAFAVGYDNTCNCEHYRNGTYDRKKNEPVFD